MELYQRHKALLSKAIESLSSRQFFSPYPEHPKAYEEGLDEQGKERFGRLLNQNFEELGQEADHWKGEEISPLWQLGIGVKYPTVSIEKYIANSKKAASTWKKYTIHERAAILMESLERIRSRFFELAYSTMHTTGQSHMMAFQASGPHAADRALEAIAMGVQELTKYPKELTFVKPLGKFNLTVEKSWKPIPKGIGLVIGCSTFPTWNTVPGVYANLISGNTVLVKPHPKSILPIAIFVAELRKVIKEQGGDPDAVQLTVDKLNEPITEKLARHKDVKLVDYTGGNEFGTLIESLNKAVFTEKSGINSVILDSVEEIKEVAKNIAFSVSLYSGQMCTAPQNIFIPQVVSSSNGDLTFAEVAQEIAQALKGVLTHPKMGAGTLGSIQNDGILKRIEAHTKNQPFFVSPDVVNEEAPNARIKGPTLVKVKSSDTDYRDECFGPMVFLIETTSTQESLNLAAELAETKGAISCLAFTTNKETQVEIEEKMNAAFTPVSFNFSGAGFVNQHAAFSDFHGTGGNPAGNATFVDASFVNKRFVWIGNRSM